MCISLGTAALVVGIAGAATSAYSAISSSQAASAQAAYQAQVARNNQSIADQNAAAATRAGEAQAEATSRKNAATQGAIRAAEAANNVDVNSGSAADLQTSQREIGELNTLNTMNNAMLTAYGYKTQGTGYGAQSGLLSSESKQDIEGGYLSAAGGLASNASSLGFKWSSSQNPDSAT